MNKDVFWDLLRNGHSAYFINCRIVIHASEKQDKQIRIPSKIKWLLCNMHKWKSFVCSIHIRSQNTILTSYFIILILSAVLLKVHEQKNRHITHGCKLDNLSRKKENKMLTTKLRDSAKRCYTNLRIPYIYIRTYWIIAINFMLIQQRTTFLFLLLHFVHSWIGYYGKRTEQTPWRV